MVYCVQVLEQGMLKHLGELEVMHLLVCDTQTRKPNDIDVGNPLAIYGVEFLEERHM